MTFIKRIKSKNSIAFGPYHPAVEVDLNGVSQLFVSGQGTKNPKTGERCLGDIRAQATMAMDNLKTVIDGCGYKMEDIVKTSLFLTNMADSKIVNEVYQEYFSNGQYPARAAMGVKELPGGQSIEIEAIAMKKNIN